MYEVLQTERFSTWLAELQDERARQLINVRLVRLGAGHFGDSKAVGDGISELRVHFGPGYRVYVKRTARTVVVVLAGGSKSTQTADIQAAKLVAQNLPRST